LRLCGESLFLILALAVLLILFFANGTQAQSKTTQFDPDGSYWLLGDQPTEFSEFGAINLNAKKLRRLPSPGLQLNDGTNYRYKTLTVKRNNFTFTTVARRGVYYTFSGRFLKGGVLAMTELNDESPILEGTLTRYNGGKKVAEAKLRFTYFGGT
jgi:hypothetical protein